MEKLKDFIMNSKYLTYLNDPKVIGTSAALALAAAAYFMKQRRELETFVAKFSCQSLEIPGPELIRVNAMFPSLITVDDIESKTIHEIFMKGVSVSGTKPFLGWRPDGNSDYNWHTYDEVYAMALYLGSALYELGYRKGDLIGISAINKPEWVVVDQGAMMFSMVLVPLYDTLGGEAFRHILKQTEISLVFCDSKKLGSIVDNAEESKFLKTVIIFDDVKDSAMIEKCDAVGIKLLTMNQLLDIGKESTHQPTLPSPDDLALICYTSGTTGNPKGVMLTHGNIAVNIATFFKYILEYHLSPSDCHISYLPLSHMYERSAQYILMYAGGRIGFFRGNVKELVQDIQMLKPTLFAAVPRVLNTLHDKVMNEISKSWLKSLIMKMALSSKENEVNRGILRKDSFWDRLIFTKLQALLGGRVNVITSGAAPLSSSVKNFFKCAFGCRVYEGYGQTELTTLATFTASLDPYLGHVGPPAPCCRIKLVDVPEMDYFANDGRGEICVHGDGVFAGYYKEPEKTRETLDERGWCHTGDIGKWLPNGTLCIIDRKKHIFKLAQGEYIAPEKIEVIYLRCLLVAQVYVTGNSLQPCTVAVVVPDEEMLQSWANANNHVGTFEDMCKKKAVVTALLETMRESGSAGGLNSLEQVKAIYVTPDAFSIENGLLTPTMKVKRKKIEDLYADKIAFLYNELKQTNQIR